jgi:glycerol transport system ATP-binding protein
VPLAEVLLKDLSHRYPGAAADTLSNLNLQIASGEAHALLGSSGAGKSTLLNLLSGLLPGSPGQLQLGGRELAAQTPAQRGIAQVFQFPVLYEAMTVLGNLMFPLQVMGMKKADARGRARRLAEQLQIDHLLKRKPGRLDLFEKQLVAIGKALVRPDLALVLLDEPLTAAAPERKWRLRQTLKTLQQESGATMIYVTHDQTEALTFADRISVMHRGGILQTGTPEELLTAPGHEYVGFFVGSPGMNFLAADVAQSQCVVDGHPIGRCELAAGPCRLGFRPEWAQLVSVGGEAEGALAAQITGTRVLGTHRGQTFGLVDAKVAETPIVTRQPLAGVRQGAAQLHIRDWRVFRDGWATDAG